MFIWFLTETPVAKFVDPLNFETVEKFTMDFSLQLYRKCTFTLFQRDEIFLYC